MKVKGLDGREYSWSLGGHQHTPNQARPRSELHLTARTLLKELYISFPLLEEVYIPGPDKMYLDFFIPNAKIGVEVHGEQHFKFVPYFHKTKAGWLYAQMRDRDKAEWCELNEIELIVFRFDSSEEDWRQQIEYGC